MHPVDPGSRPVTRNVRGRASASLFAAGIIQPALKFAFGRNPPSAEEGAYSFRPFTYDLKFSGGAQSFPSGHATESFAIASVIAEHYDEAWVKATVYSLASLVGVARLYQGVHFVSDFAAGAAIGALVGKETVRFNEERRKKKKEQQVFVTPLMAPGAAGVQLNLIR